MCDRALKTDFELKGTIREGMKSFWSGVSGAGFWAQKSCYQRAVRGEKVNILSAVHTEGFSLMPYALVLQICF